MSLRSALFDWAGRSDLRSTALTSLLDEDPDPTGPAEAEHDVVESPLLLSPSQRAVVRRARTAPLTVVSGAPGTGKTQTVCALALDAVAAGRSVLVATQSAEAATVVAELLDRTPGPDPVRFGSSTGMAALIDELSDHQVDPMSHDAVHALELDLAAARARRDGIRRTIEQRLDLERAAADAAGWADALPALVAAAPGLFEPGADHRLAATLAGRAGSGRDGFVARRRRRRAERQLRRLAGATPDVALADLEVALTAATARRAAAQLATDGGDGLDGSFEALLTADDAFRDSLGRRLAARPFEPGVLDHDARRALGSLIAALRAGRGRRRELLAHLPAGDLTAAAPLWIGTLAEIDDVLPASPALFDLVILDEASQIDQVRAATALLRGARAVIVGDPHQLRHVSFVPDEQVSSVLGGAGLGEDRARLDVRRVSAFDLAAMAAPIQPLREHFRSVPHLIDFPLHHFYRDTVSVMTRHPACEMVDAIDVVPVDGDGPDRDVRPAEVAAVQDLLRSLLEDGADDVGVISPFRSQADALEDMIARTFSDDEIARLRLRVGTIHAFQGGERQVVIASIGLHPDDDPGRRRFVEDPNLFNVMVTRARRRMVVVTAIGADDPGLLGAYLRHAGHPLAAVAGTPPTDRWTGELATELDRAEVPTRTGYPVGPWSLDLVVGTGTDARSVECRVLDDGPAGHVSRGLTLRRLGWRVVDGFPTRWDGDAVRAALELTDRLRTRS